MSSGSPLGRVTRYSCAIGTIGTSTPASAPSSRANIPPALTTTSVSISPLSVTTPVTRPVPDLDRESACGGGHLRTSPPRALGERERELRRVDVAVRRQVGGAEHAVRGHRREELLRLGRRDQLERQAERLRPAGLARDLLQPLLRGREPQRADLAPARLEPDLVPDRSVELDARHHHLRQRERAAQLADEARRVERRARASARPARRGRRRPSRAARASRGSSSRRRRRRSPPLSPARASHGEPNRPTREPFRDAGRRVLPRPRPRGDAVRRSRIALLILARPRSGWGSPRAAATTTTRRDHDDRSATEREASSAAEAAPHCRAASGPASTSASTGPTASPPAATRSS